jgi:hypothetical protein
VDERLVAVPIDLAEVEAGMHQAKLIANPPGDRGSVRIVEHDALFLIVETLALVDLGDDRLEVIASKPSTVSLLRSVYLVGSFLSRLKTLPCQAKQFTTFEIALLNTVPEAMIAVPSVSPSGIFPAGDLANSASSSALDIFRRSSVVMVFLFGVALGMKRGGASA